MYIQEQEERDFHHSSLSEVLSAWAARGERDDPQECACRGRGWILTDMDTWIECGAHRGQRHPEDESNCCPFCGKEDCHCAEGIEARARWAAEAEAHKAAEAAIIEAMGDPFGDAESADPFADE